MPPSDTPAANTIFLGGRVRTLDARGTCTEAIAVAGNRIAAVGSNDDIRALVGPSTKVIELDGATVIPGFNDTHAHMDREGLKSIRPTLKGAKSIADVLNRIRTAAANTPAGEWIVTMPVGEPPYYFGGPDTLAEKRMPDRNELDLAAPDHPVCISAVFANWGQPPGYTALNSRALRLNGIDRETKPSCDGVEIMRDRFGDPTGVIVEGNPRPTVDNDLLPAVPRFTFSQRRDALVRSMQLYNAAGTTSVYEGHGLSERTIDAYRELWRQDLLTTRLGFVLSPAWESFREARAALNDWASEARGETNDDSWFRTCGLHVAFGGNSVSAALSRKSLPDTGWAGFVEQANDESDFLEYCMLCADNDIRMHTIALDNLHRIVPILEKVAERFDIRGRRWVVEHIARSRQEDLDKLRQMDILVTTIPVYFVWKGGARYFADADRGESVVPIRSMLDSGMYVAAGTDNIPYDPAFTLWNMVTRQERTTGKALGPGQAVTSEEALRLMTVAGAMLTGDEKEKGPLTPGNLADLAVLAQDPVTLAPEKLTELECLFTMVDGRLVHQMT
ncbi:amidohydrolase [Hoeflea sp. CAU 1731]